MEIIDGMSSSPPPTPQQIAEAERQLGDVRFPDDYRRWLLERNGAEGWFGESFLMLHSLGGVVEATQAAEAEERLPGLVAIGSDGSREIVAFDFRRSPPRVVLVDVTAEAWQDALPQAQSFTDFMAQRERGEPFVWERSEA